MEADRESDDEQPHRDGRHPPGQRGPDEPFNPTPTAELTALAAHLRRLSDRVERMASMHANLADAVSGQMVPQLVELRHDSAERFALHATQIQQLLDAVETRKTKPVPWPALSAAQADTEWDALATWIDEVLVAWYELTRQDLPDCWALHRPAVVELSWLHSAHQEAYRPGAAAHEAADWHTRWRTAALTRVREIIPLRGVRSCGPGEHLTNELERSHRKLEDLATPGTLPSEQLAERRHWDSFFRQAKAADLSWRSDR